MPNCCPIASLGCTLEGGDQWESIYFELTTAIGVGADRVDDSLGRPRPLRCVIERQENFESGLGGCSVGLWYLGRCCLICGSNIEGKCIDAGGERQMHVIHPVTLAVGVGIANLVQIRKID